MVALVVGFICGLISAMVANSKGRSAIGWFFGGFFLGLIGLIIVCCLSDLKKQEAKERNAERERRRLREQLKQERMKTATFQQHVHKRLDTHDSALGMNTRQTPALAAAQSPPALPDRGDNGRSGAHQPLMQSSEPEPVWHYSMNERKYGPFTEADLRERFREGELNRHGYLWRPGMDDWRPATQVTEFRGTI